MHNIYFSIIHVEKQSGLKKSSHQIANFRNVYWFLNKNNHPFKKQNNYKDRATKVAYN